MGLFTNPGWYAGGILPGLIANNFGGSSFSPSAPSTNIPMTAKNVKLPSDLTTALSGPGTSAYSTIGSNYKRAATQFGNDAAVRGQNPSTATGPNSYFGQQSGIHQGLDYGNLESALGGGLGSTAYENALQERQFGQNEDLARRVADLNRPDLLQQILGGIGNVGGTAAQTYGAFGRNPRSRTGGSDLISQDSYTEPMPGRMF